MTFQQDMFNIVLTIAGALAGWWMKAMWESLKELRLEDQKIHQTVTQLQILVAGNYVRADQFNVFAASLGQQLTRIEDKLDHKADKL